MGRLHFCWRGMAFQRVNTGLKAARTKAQREASLLFNSSSSPAAAGPAFETVQRRANEQDFGDTLPSAALACRMNQVFSGLCTPILVVSSDTTTRLDPSRTRSPARKVSLQDRLTKCAPQCSQNYAIVDFDSEAAFFESFLLSKADPVLPCVSLPGPTMMTTG